MLRAGSTAPGGKPGSAFGNVGNSGSVGVERQRHQAVAAADAALDDREDRVLLREAAEAAANRPLLIALRIPGKAEARIEVVLVRAGRPVGNVLDDLDVVAQAEVERQVVADAPVVLEEAGRARRPSGTSAAPRASSANACVNWNGFGATAGEPEKR